MSDYEHLAALVNKVRNARFGEMVRHLEELIENDLWRDFTTPIGTRFQFRSHEFDYFLASEDLDATTARHAYLHGDLPDMASRQFRLADITGRGAPPPKIARRPVKEVAELYASDPSGAGARILRWQQGGQQVVTDRIAIAAKDPERRKAIEAGQETRIERPKERVWRVRWSDGRPAVQVIVDKLSEDPALEAAVYRALHSKYIRNYRDDKKRRSEGRDAAASARDDS